jgi:ELWxxDGT repeat protein
VYFTANTGSGYEWWRTDGTNAGTLSISAGITNISDYIVNGSSLIFTARTAATGYEIFIHDTTTTTSALLKDINPGSQNGVPSHFAEVNGTIFFAANDGVNGFEFWKTDGTASGTILAMDYTPGPSGSGINQMLNVGNRLIILSGNKTILDSDGTLIGTHMVPHLYPEDASPDVFRLYQQGTELLIVGETYLYGRELYKYTPSANLPVEWLGAEVNWQFNNGLIEWYTTEENNIETYRVQRKLFGEDFETIAELSPQGEGNSIQSYNYLDVSIPEEADLIHYRIQELDLDGKSSYSEVLTLKRRKSVQFTAYPNPGRETLRVKANPRFKDCWLSVSDLNGKILSEQRLGMTETIISTEHLKSGTYLIIIEDKNGETQCRKWTKF